MAEFKGARIFLNIPVVAARNENLLAKPKSLLLLGEIVSMLNVTGKFFMSNKQIALRLHCTVQAVKNYLNLLEKERMIVRRNVKSETNNSIIGRTIEAGPALLEANIVGWATGVSEGRKQALPNVGNTNCRGVGNRHCPKENSLKEQSNRSINRNISATTNYTIKVQEVVEYLNKKTGKSFKPNAKGNRSAIIPRLKEGYTVDQLKKVIDNKVTDWQGVTFRNGQPGDNYLTPTTLFRPSKIDGYLNETPHKDTRQANQQKWQKESQEFSSDYAF